MKLFLLTAGDYYYPQCDTGNWIGCFETREKAEQQIEYIVVHEYFTRGPRKGQIKEGQDRTYYKIRGIKYDWCEIIDLKDWIC